MKFTHLSLWHCFEYINVCKSFSEDKARAFHWSYMVGSQPIDIKWYPIEFCILLMTLSGFDKGLMLFKWKCAIVPLYLWHQNVVFPSSLAQWHSQWLRNRIKISTPPHTNYFSFWKKICSGVPIHTIAYFHTSLFYFNLHTFYYKIYNK